MRKKPPADDRLPFLSSPGSRADKEHQVIATSSHSLCLPIKLKKKSWRELPNWALSDSFKFSEKRSCFGLTLIICYDDVSVVYSQQLCYKKPKTSVQRRKSNKMPLAYPTRNLTLLPGLKQPWANPQMFIS